MRLHRRQVVLGVFVLACGIAVPAAPQAPAVTAASLSPEEMRQFLTTARIVKRRNLSQGVTNSQVATLSDGRITHDAHVQTVDIAMQVFRAGTKTELNFKDSYRYNIAAYHLALLLGMDNVPMSVERRVGGKLAAVTWWLDDVLMDEKQRVAKGVASPDRVAFGRQRQMMRVFDELIQNVDRNQQNVVWGSDWRLWLIDHTRAFRLGRELQSPASLEQCPRSLLDGLRRLRLDELTKAAGLSLTRQEAEAVLARRDLIVTHYEARIAALGEEAVLF